MLTEEDVLKEVQEMQAEQNNHWELKEEELNALIKVIAEDDLYLKGKKIIPPSSRDLLFNDAARDILRFQIPSAAYLCRKLKISLKRAENIFVQLTDTRIIQLMFVNEKQTYITPSFSDIQKLEEFLCSNDLVFDRQKKKKEFVQKRYAVKIEAEIAKEKIKQKLLEKGKQKKLKDEVEKELIRKRLILKKNKHIQ